MTIGTSMNFSVYGTGGTGVTLREYGTITRRRTELIVAATHVLVTTPDSENLAQGALIYTFPAGQIIVHRVYGDVGIEINDANLIGDTPEIGLGTVVATGANATLGAAAAGITAENLWGPHVAAGCDTGATPGDAGQFLSTLDFVMADAAVHTVYLNCAGVWTDGAGTADAVLQNDARFIIDWTILPLGGV